MKDDERAMAMQARITSSDAARIAVTAFPGKVMETQLGEENGYLVWRVEGFDPKGNEAQLKIDAGNGRLLAVESGEHESMEERDHEERQENGGEDRAEGKHSSWTFWEDNDRDEQEGDRD